MSIMLVIFLVLSLTANGILVWYCRKLIKNLWYGVNNVDQLQNLLNDYANSLQSIYELEEFYEDDTIRAAINNTKTIAEACRVYKNTLIEKQDEDDSEETIQKGSRANGKQG